MSAALTLDEGLGRHSAPARQSRLFSAERHAQFREEGHFAAASSPGRRQYHTSADGDFSIAIAKRPAEDSQSVDAARYHGRDISGQAFAYSSLRYTRHAHLLPTRDAASIYHEEATIYRNSAQFHLYIDFSPPLII